MHVRVHKPYLHGSVWSQYLCWGSQMFFASCYEDQLFTNEKTTLSEQVCPSYSITYRIHKAGVHCRHIYSVLFGHELPVPMDIYSTDCSKSNTLLYLCCCWHLHYINLVSNECAWSFCPLSPCSLLTCHTFPSLVVLIWELDRPVDR